MQNLNDNISQFDWNFLNIINYDIIKESNDYDSLEKIIYSFVDSNFGQVETKFLPHPISEKFYKILQLSINYLLKQNQKILKEKKRIEKENQNLKLKLQNIIEKYEKFTFNSVQNLNIVFSCPICEKLFKSNLYLDKHIKKEHSDKFQFWLSFKKNEKIPYKEDIESIQKELDIIRSNLIKKL